MALSICRSASDFDPTIRGDASTSISLTAHGEEVNVTIRGVPPHDLSAIEAAESAAEQLILSAATQASALPFSPAVRAELFRALAKRI